MDVIECRSCHRMFNNTDHTGVCPSGHENHWATDEDEDTDYLRGIRG